MSLISPFVCERLCTSDLMNKGVPVISHQPSWLEGRLAHVLAQERGKDEPAGATFVVANSIEPDADPARTRSYNTFVRMSRDITLRLIA